MLPLNHAPCLSKASTRAPKRSPEKESGKASWLWGGQKLSMPSPTPIFSYALSYTIFSVPGFYQGLITQYAVPILDQQSVWVTGDKSSVPYIDTQDVAKFVIKALTLEVTENNTYPLVGPSSWTSKDIVSLCEKLSGRKSNVKQIPLFGLTILKQTLRTFEWTWNISDRLAFAEVLSNSKSFKTDISDTYKIFGLDIADTLTLEKYFQEYFGTMLAKLKGLNYDQNQKRRDITF